MKKLTEGEKQWIEINSMWEKEMKLKVQDKKSEFKETEKHLARQHKLQFLMLKEIDYAEKLLADYNAKVKKIRKK